MRRPLFLKIFEDAGFDTDDQVIAYLKTYGFEEELIYSSVCDLSGGEKNLLQLAKISRTGAGLLLLDGSQPVIWTHIPNWHWSRR